MLAERILLTAADLQAMPDSGRGYELVKGELQRMAPTSPKHGKIAARLIIRLGTFVEANELGEVYSSETGFTLEVDPDTVRAPDAAFVSADRIPEEDDSDGYWVLAPDLVAEVLSPSDAAGTVLAKVQDYLDAGVRLVWVIDPRSKSVTVYRSLKDVQVFTVREVLSGQDVLPGFSLPVSALFG